MDNGSEKESFERISSTVSDNHYISLIRIEKNQGYSKGNNIGIKYAIEKFGSKYVLIMNSDIVVPDQGVINNLLTRLKDYENSHVVAIMPLIWNIGKYPHEPNKQIQIRKIENYLDTLLCNSPIMKRICTRRFNNYIYKEQMPFDKLIHAQVLSGAFLIIRTDFLLDIGLLDERTFLFHEEIILGKRMDQLGVSGLLDPSQLVHHLVGASFNHTDNNFSGYRYAHKTLSQYYYIKEYLKSGRIKKFLFLLLRSIEALLLAICLNKNLTEYTIYREICLKLKDR